MPSNIVKKTTPVRAQATAAKRAVSTNHPLGDHAGKLLHPDEVLRRMGVTQPVHPNQAARMFWRYCKDKGLIR